MPEHSRPLFGPLGENAALRRLAVAGGTKKLRPIDSVLARADIRHVGAARQAARDREKHCGDDRQELANHSSSSKTSLLDVQCRCSASDVPLLVSMSSG